MPVVRSASGEISLPTDSHRDLGLFLMFLGLAVSFPLRNLGLRLWPEASWPSFLSPTGCFLLVLGFVLVRYTRKRFFVQGQQLCVKDGWLKRRLRYAWEGSPCIRLRSQEEEQGVHTKEFWLVNLVDGKRQYVLDRREGHQIESRSLAEALAKTINCPVLEKCETGEITIPREELDLPFRERVKLHPDLLGEEAKAPEACPVDVSDSPQGQKYTWRLLNAAMLNEFFTLVFFLVVLAVVPIFPRPVPGEEASERFALSFLHLALQKHQYIYFYVAGSLIAAGALVLFGYSKELVLTQDKVSAQDRLWGVPTWSASIPASQLEEIWVRQSTRGAHLQLISDACIISGRIANSQVAAWLASRIRRFYATGGSTT